MGSHVFFNCFVFVFPCLAEEESVGWGPVLASLQVPELTVDDFLTESQSGGSFLTLYAFILQRLNSEYTAANERRTLALINTWTNLVYPRLDLHCLFWLFQYFTFFDGGYHNDTCHTVFCVFSGPGDEAKLFLWWHKALNLSVEQLQPQAGHSELSGVVMGLLRLQTRLIQLGEERINSGILGAIGLGKRSPVSNRYDQMHRDYCEPHDVNQLLMCICRATRFRVVVRSLAAFLSVQIPSETELRLQPTNDLQPSAKAQQVSDKNCKRSVFIS